MRSVSRLINERDETAVAARVVKAETVWQRFIGLLCQKTVAPDEGIWFDRCSAVHTLGMRATIDVIFLDSQRRVLQILHGVKPNRFFVGHRRASALVELGSAPPAQRNVSVGDRLRLQRIAG